VSGSRTFWRVIDLIIVVCVIATVWRLVHASRMVNSSVHTRVKPIAINSTFRLPTVQWAGARQHIVVLIDSACAACAQSAAFYSALSDYAAAETSVKFIVISARASGEIQQWLDEHRIYVHQLVHVSDAYSLGFVVEPTLLLVNQDGLVTDVMARKLSLSDERRVFARLAGDDQILNNAATSPEIDEAELARAAEQIVVLDVRARKAFGRRHRPKAVNIPADELIVRAPIELRQPLSLVIDCVEATEAECRSADEALRRLGFVQVRLLVPKGLASRAAQ